MKKIYRNLKKKTGFVRKETLKIHGRVPEVRIASCLSPIEIFVALYYGKILNFNPDNPLWEKRDRFIVSKGHGSVPLYVIFADLGFFSRSKLNDVGRKGTNFNSIPDCSVKGIEAVNGSLGHGLGIGCGMALALKRKKNSSKVIILLGDGELFEGSVWEAIMFASHHKLDNLMAIIDNNKLSMLDYTKNIIDLNPLRKKWKDFGWLAEEIDGHNIEQVHEVLVKLKNDETCKPKVLIAHTIKGKGVPKLENNPLSHVMSLTQKEIDEILKGQERHG